MHSNSLPECSLNASSPVPNRVLVPLWNLTRPFPLPTFHCLSILIFKLLPKCLDNLCLEHPRASHCRSSYLLSSYNQFHRPGSHSSSPLLGTNSLYELLAATKYLAKATWGRKDLLFGLELEGSHPSWQGKHVSGSRELLLTLCPQSRSRGINASA